MPGGVAGERPVKAVPYADPAIFSPCRSEPAREKPEGAVALPVLRVISQTIASKPGPCNGSDRL